MRITTQMSNESLAGSPGSDCSLVRGNGRRRRALGAWFAKVATTERPTVVLASTYQRAALDTSFRGA